MQLYDSSKDLVLIGGGGHSKVVIDAIASQGMKNNIIGIIDSDPKKVGIKILDVPIIGTEDIFKQLFKNGLRKVLISIGMVEVYQVRSELYNLLRNIGFELISICHKNSIISEYSEIGEGNVVLAGAIINAGAKIGNNCILNTGSIIEHDCTIGNNVHIAPGAKLSGNVTVKDNCMIGIGASIIQGITIGENCIVGAGSTIIRNVPPNVVVAGTPGRIIRSR